MSMRGDARVCFLVYYPSHFSREMLIQAVDTCLSSKVVSQNCETISPMAVDAVLGIIDPLTATNVDLRDIKARTKLLLSCGDRWRAYCTSTFELQVAIVAVVAVGSQGNDCSGSVKSNAPCSSMLWILVY